MSPPSEYVVERRAIVAAPPERVFEHVVDFHRWASWSPWEDLDPNLQREYTGPTEGVGAAYAWSGNRKAGQGRMEITEATRPSTIAIALEFLKPFRASNVTRFDFTPVDGGTEVVWTMTGPKTFTTRLMSVFMTMDTMIGRDFEKGLARLADVVRG